MKVYTPDVVVPDRRLRNSIFLAGPTPRSKEVETWRGKALELLTDLNFKGSVFVPEMLGAEQWNPVYDEQIEWEHKALYVTEAIVFWVPRDIKGGMPAFTTNVEFGMFLNDERMFYGRPDWAEKCKYLDYCYKDAKGEIPKNDLCKLLREAMEYLK